MKKKSTVAGGGQVSTVEDDVRANGDDLGASAHNKLELSERSRSDLSRQSDTEDEDEEVSFPGPFGLAWSATVACKNGHLLVDVEM